MTSPRYPSLYQVNTRVWLTELSGQLGRRATLDDIPDANLKEFARQGFDWIWLLSVWQTGNAAKLVSRSNPEWRHEFQETLPDLTDDDIEGSGFAITNYVVHHDLGGDAALARLRRRMQTHGLKLMLDFVPNHMAPDHPWVSEHPDYFVGGSELDLVRSPQNFFRRPTKAGSQYFAHGRDPYFPGWPDTIQLNYGNPALQNAMIGELTRIAGQCDGVRCDMAMLILPGVFQRTWGISLQPFWPSAIKQVHGAFPDFVFMAEVYWGLEWELQQQGFNYCYDKCLYDRLHQGYARPVREHFYAGLDYQDRLARFLENHDELRAATTFDIAKHQAAATITYLSPGLRFFHQGQFEGLCKRISPHLVRAPEEPANEALVEFYSRLLAVLRQPALRDGQWSLMECRPAWDGNWTHECFVAFAWEKSVDERLIVIVNFADHQSQARVHLPFESLPGNTIHLKELIGTEEYEHPVSELMSNGLFVDLPSWGSHVFSVSNRCIGKH
jgi:hypothetical protein